MTVKAESCTYEIEHGIPIPKQESWKHSRWKRLAESMQDGDSVVVKNNGERSSLAMQIKRSGRDVKIVSRRLEDGRVRVWVKDKAEVAE